MSFDAIAANNSARRIRPRSLTIFVFDLTWSLNIFFAPRNCFNGRTKISNRSSLHISGPHVFDSRQTRFNSWQHEDEAASKFQMSIYRFNRVSERLYFHSDQLAWFEWSLEACLWPRLKTGSQEMMCVQIVDLTLSVVMDRQWKKHLTRLFGTNDMFKQRQWMNEVSIGQFDASVMRGTGWYYLRRRHRWLNGNGWSGS